MKKVKLLGVSLFLGSMVVFTSCAKFPQEQYDSTKAVVAEVKAAGADVYVPAPFKQLTDSLVSAEVKLNADKSKWFTRYGDSKLYLTGVTNFASEIKTKNLDRKAELTKQNEALLTEIATLVTTNKELVGTAPKGKGGKEALAAITNEISIVETSVAQAKSSTNLLDANDKLTTAKEKLVSLKAELDTAISKTNVKAVKHTKRK